MHVNFFQLICVQGWPAVMEEPVRSEAAPVYQGTQARTVKVCVDTALRALQNLIYTYHQRHQFLHRLKMGSMQSYGTVYN